MRYSSLFVSTTALAVLLASVPSVQADDHGRDQSVQLGPRPFYLVDGMDDGWLKSRLSECKAGPFHKTDFSIGHRGAALQFPEHTKEAYQAGARQGAGIVECDVTFTKDKKLVCRHSDCDLHTTTNIVDTPLRARRRSAAPGISRWPSSRRCAARWTRATRRPARPPATWAAPQAGARTSTPVAER